jgi:phosphoserine aminotransferase
MTDTLTPSTANDSPVFRSASGRTFNFSAGPGCLPEEVLRRAQEDIWDLFGTGIGILEHSHRGAAYDRVLHEAIADCREVGSVSDDYEVLFIPGGATSQCFMVPANLLPEGKTADYFLTGKWASDSYEECKLYGTPHICGSSKDTGYDHIPTGDAVRYSDNPVYVHFTSNNTIMGTEFHAEPEAPGDAFLVCDASSDMFSRPVDVSKYGIMYAGAQKNLGPASTVVALVRKDLIANGPVRPLPKMLDYSIHAKKESRYNTPPTFGVYLVGQMLKWVLANGGVEGMAKKADERSSLIYNMIDASGFYRGHATPESRSRMNITFKTPDEATDKKFTAEATAAGLDGLGGHRSVGGMRASIYNSMPLDGVKALVSFMQDFERRHG